MKSIMMSIQPRWCASILNGDKILEIRKTRPGKDVPFKVYIYCTKSGLPLVYGDRPCAGGYVEEYCQTYGYSREEAERNWDVLNGKVVGEFTCSAILTFWYEPEGKGGRYVGCPYLHPCSRLDYDGIYKYIGEGVGYAWHISDLVIYDEPKTLEDFGLKKAPQSWCYVKEKICQQ